MNEKTQFRIPTIAYTLFVCILCDHGLSHASLVVDISHDVANGNFFGSNPLARAALDAAVSDINSTFDISLAPITSGITTGSGGGANVSATWTWNYSNPSTGATEQYNGGVAEIPGNDVIVYAGMNQLTGGTLGRGGPGGLTSNISAGGNFGGFQAAFDDAMNNSQMHRGGGPIIRRTTGAFLGASYSFDHAPSIGSIQFDNDSNNDGQIDSAAMLDQYWHFDHTTTVAAGKNDFYSVALHELLHSLGIGTSLSWDENVNGSDWIGSNVIAVHGTGLNLIGGGHFRQNITSQRINDGTSQTPLLAPFLLTGTRSEMTELDVAAMNDIGWQSQLTPVPEPSSLAAIAAMFMSLGIRGRRRV